MTNRQTNRHYNRTTLTTEYNHHLLAFRVAMFRHCVLVPLQQNKKRASVTFCSLLSYWLHAELFCTCCVQSNLH